MLTFQSLGAKRLGLRRLLALISIPLLAASATVALTATPAQASLTYQGTFTIQAGGGCAQVQNNGRTAKTPIQLGVCNASNAQRWAIYLESGTSPRYWILAYGGEQPLNMCMDVGNYSHMWIYNCNGGNRQKWGLASGTSATPQKIRSEWDTALCAGFDFQIFTLYPFLCSPQFGEPEAPLWALQPA